MAGHGEDLHRGCTRAREWASLRLDGELSELERLLLRRHLVRCEPCRVFTETSAAATSLMRRAPLERPARRIEVPVTTPTRRRKHGRLVAALAAALAVGAAAGGAVVASSGEGPEPRPTITIVQLPDPPPTTLTQPGENV